MKKLAARKIPVIALIVSVVLLAGTVAAWLSLGDYIEGMNFSILKINSTVTMYAARGFQPQRRARPARYAS